MPFALDQEGLASPEDTAISKSVVAPCTIPNRPCDCWNDTRYGCRGAALCNPWKPCFTITNWLCDCWNGGGTALHIITRRIPSLFGGQLSHSLTRDQLHRLDCLLLGTTIRVHVGRLPPRAKPLRFPASPFPLLVPASTRLLPRNAKVSPCDARWRCSWDGRGNTKGLQQHSPNLLGKCCSLEPQNILGRLGHRPTSSQTRGLVKCPDFLEKRPQNPRSIFT